MSSNLNYFCFDVNFGVGSDSVFANIDKTDNTPPPPPPSNNFLLLDSQPFLLLNGQNLTLSGH